VLGRRIQKRVTMNRGTPILRGHRALITGCLVFGAGILVGQNSLPAGPDSPHSVPVPVAQSAPAPDLPVPDPAGLVPSDAPVANLITLRSMAPQDQSRFLSRMTDPQLVALQTVALTTPNVLPQANEEALSRGLPELEAGGTDSFGAVRAVPVVPTPGVRIAPPDPAPPASDPCDDCQVVSA
jgi:hypothetical protein